METVLPVSTFQTALRLIHSPENNLDYIFQMVNGWILNKDGRALGSIREYY
jgi:hypothetical protein